MAIRFSCPCGAALQSADEFSGGQIHCEVCGSMVVVPDPAWESAPKIRYPCPNCATPLVAKATSPGKRSKCPACDQVYLVPHVEPQPVVNQFDESREPDRRLKIDTHQVGILPDNMNQLRRDNQGAEGQYRFLPTGEIIAIRHDQNTAQQPQHTIPLAPDSPTAAPVPVDQHTPHMQSMPLAPTNDPMAPPPVAGAAPSAQQEYAPFGPKPQPYVAPTDSPLPDLTTPAQPAGDLPVYMDDAAASTSQPPLITDDMFATQGDATPLSVEPPSEEQPTAGPPPRSPNAPPPELRFTGGEMDGEIVTMKPKRFLVGRARDCQLRPVSDVVSLHHCVFNRDDFAVRIRDLGSHEGTYVNGWLIEAEVILSHGDRVRIGDVRLQIVFPELGPAESLDPPGASAVTELNAETSLDDLVLSFKEVIEPPATETERGGPSDTEDSGEYEVQTAATDTTPEDANPRLRPCPDCDQPVSKRARQCPHCGCPLTDRSR